MWNTPSLRSVEVHIIHVIWEYFASLRIPTVSLDVISLAASSWGYYRGLNRVICCVLIRDALSNPERACETFTTPPSAVRSARCTPAVVSQWASTADPEALHRSGTTSRARTPRWLNTGGETPQLLHIPRDAMPARLSDFRLLAMTVPPLAARQKLLI